MLLKHTTVFVCVCIATGWSITIQKTLPAVAFDSSNENREQFKLETLKIKRRNSLNRTTIYLAFRVYGPRTSSSLTEQWFVDGVPVKSIFLKADDFAQGMSSDYMDSYVEHRYYIETKLPVEVLREKKFQFYVRYYIEDNILDMGKFETRWFYSSFKYKITLYGKDIFVPNSGNNIEHKFDTLDYFISKENDLKKYEAKFSFDPKSASTVREVSASFEGFDKKTRDDYMSTSSWCTEKCESGNIIDISQTGSSGTSKEVHVKLSDITQTEFNGVFRVNVFSTNIAKSDIEMSFDLTSYLYDGINRFSPFFAPKSLTISTHYYTLVGNKAVIYCRGFGYEYPSMESYKESDGTEISDKKEERTYIYEQYVMTEILTIDWKEENRGTYICKLTAQHYPGTVTSSIEV